MRTKDKIRQIQFVTNFVATHDGNTEGCDAALGGRGFRLQNGRVYFYASYSFYGGDGGVALASISAGGGDRRLEKAISATLPGVGGQWRNCMSSVGDVLFCSGMNEAGTFDNVAVLENKALTASALQMHLFAADKPVFKIKPAFLLCLKFKIILQTLVLRTYGCGPPDLILILLYYVPAWTLP